MTIDQAIEEEEAKVEEPRNDKNEVSEIEWISPVHNLQQKISDIPDKMGFKIGEAAEIVGVKQYVLRYWETEFDVLHPKKSKNGQRMYTKKDVETALLIRKLLHDDRFSIEGARTALKRLRKQMKDLPEPQEEVASKKTMVIEGSAVESAQRILDAIRDLKSGL
ncbi:MAG: MerR family transcriptional regulator [Bdellovibrionales bacterium]|nr:MerR family transcriptional regulator [Bdellovibrionales bacterium]